ncbi:type II toxin-antitoxin system mRNA interferase toxin, RelE/StbE family [Candidatus Azambacteria bacterium]|nr:type II toxin-antitoxin system mRNA interferase toxin, RelE/StbE family [Candidatus Azambacteria bacterium]MBI3685429.1 type II toxin-antitoxin system mRNA interferase toxin, RelE/StbE family [Candidatus Azambacteria bacterium]
MEIKLSPRFKKSFAKLHPRIQRKAVEKMAVFRKNQFDPRLNTHKLRGERKDEWAYSVDYSYRIVFVFLKDDVMLCLDIGTHDELY